MSICSETDKLWIFIQTNTTYSNKNEQTIAICNIFDEFHKHYVEWKKSDTEENMLYESICMKFRDRQN